MKKKRAFTLLEIMIVIFLIGLIGSVIGYNMKGSMDQGRAFKTEQSISKIKDLLELEIARTGATSKEVEDDPGKYLTSVGLLKNPDQQILDGWGQEMKVQVDAFGEVSVISQKYEEYQNK